MIEQGGLEWIVLMEVRTNEKACPYAKSRYHDRDFPTSNTWDQAFNEISDILHASPPCSFARSKNNGPCQQACMHAQVIYFAPPNPRQDSIPFDPAVPSLHPSGL